MKITGIVKKLNGSLDNEQKEMLYKVAAECRNLGATTRQLAPIYSIILIDFNRKPSEAVITEFAKKLIEGGS